MCPLGLVGTNAAGGAPERGPLKHETRAGSLLPVSKGGPGQASARVGSPSVNEADTIPAP